MLSWVMLALSDVSVSDALGNNLDCARLIRAIRVKRVISIRVIRVIRVDLCESYTSDVLR